MSLAVININDAGIQLSLDGELLRTSPGFAVLDKDKLLTGETASENARLLPRWTNNRFWAELSTNPLPNATSQVRHNADLVFAHLEDLWDTVRGKASEVIFVVPGYYDNQTLGLLLGISKEVGIPVSGVVDSSVLSACNLPLRPLVLHLDIHLHSITLSRISNAGRLSRREVTTVLETGLFTLWDRWANIISDQFIQSTRFDPMHNAASEQQMFDLLPEWITRLDSNNTHPFQLTVDGTEHSVAVSNESLLKACTNLYPQIVQAIRNELNKDENASLLLSHRFAGFPGLRDSLNLIKNVEVGDLNEMKVIGASALHRDEIVSPTGAISHILQLTAGEIVENEDRKQARNATHLLWQHQAYPIGAGFKLDGDLTLGPRKSSKPICTIYPRGGELLLECHDKGAIQINGSASTESQSVNLGDRLSIGDEIIDLIAVVND